MPLYICTILTPKKRTFRSHSCHKRTFTPNTENGDCHASMFYFKTRWDVLPHVVTSCGVSWCGATQHGNWFQYATRGATQQRNWYQIAGTKKEATREGRPVVLSG